MRRTVAMALVALVVVAMMITPSAHTFAQSQATGCEDYSGLIQEMSQLPGSSLGDIKDVTVAGNRAYFVCALGLVIADVTDPRAPQRLGVAEFPGDVPLRVAIAGRFAYVTDLLNGLRVIDVDDPTRPVVVSSLAIPGRPRDITVVGRLAYILCADTGLQVVDVGRPGRLRILGSVSTPGSARSIVVRGRTAYLCDSVSGLQLIDVSVPSRPRLLGNCGSMGQAWAVAVSGERAYVADIMGGLRVVDVSDRRAPHEVAFIETGAAGSMDIACVGSVIHLVTTQRLDTFDVSGLGAPLHIGYYLLSHQASAIAAGDGLVCVATFYGGAHFFDASAPACSARIAEAAQVSASWSAAVAGGIAYRAIRDEFLTVDVSIPGVVRDLGRLHLSWMYRPEQVVLAGSLAFVSYSSYWDDTGVFVIDISNLELPGLLANYRPAAGVDAIAAGDGYLYIVSGRSLIEIVDVGDASQPRRVGAIALDSTSTGSAHLSVVGSRVVYWRSPEGIQVFDVADVAAPRQLWAISPGDPFGDVQLVGDLLYAAGRDLQIFDLSGPGSPLLCGATAIPGDWTGDIEVVADQVYFTRSYLGLGVIDASDPRTPFAVGSIVPLVTSFTDYTGPIVGAAPSGDMILFWGPSRFYWAPRQCGGGRSVDIDIKPHAAVNLVPCGRPQGRIPVAVLSRGGFDAATVDPATVRFGPGCATARGSERPGAPCGLRDIDGDGRPDLVLEFALADADIPCGATEATLTGRTRGGMLIVGSDFVTTRPGGGRRPKIVSGLYVAPNPFNPQTAIRFQLAEPGLVSLSLYDLAGRLVRVLVAEYRPAGSHEIVWDGRDGSGQSVSSGIYLARLQSGGDEDVTRLDLVR